MTLALIVVAVTLLWGVVSGSFETLNLLLGAGFGLLVGFILRDRVKATGGLRRVRAIVALAGLFVWELLASAIGVAVLALTPNLKARLRPAIIAYPLLVTTDVEITLLASLITLTPGTLSLDVSADRSVLYVHVLQLTNRETLIAGIAAGFEARIMAVFR
ncbi:MAG: Na(+) antiporter subunit [Devosia sp.]|nr:Na(+) antiporter subunit [Devosia sp.]